MSYGPRAIRFWPSGILPDLRSRSIEQEVIDDQSLELMHRLDELAGLRRVNAVSLTCRTFWLHIRRVARENPNQPLRVLDLASGGGDTAIGLSRRARREAIPLEVHGCDISPDAVAYANSKAANAGVDAKFYVRDVVHEGIPQGYDVITSSLFLHHLTDSDAQRLLERLGTAARRLVLISDLSRSYTGYLLVCVGSRILSRSFTVHKDGPQSALAAFTRKEFSSLADRAGLRGYTIRWAWPFRFLFAWRSQ